MNPIVKRTELEHYMDLGTPESYTLTKSEPADWSSNYTDYYTLTNGTYTKVTGDPAPEWAADKFYKHTAAGSEWNRMGDGWTKFDDGTSAKTDSVKYINMDTESTDTVSYNVSYPFECDLMYKDPTIKRTYDIYKNRKTGKDCEVDILTVEIFNQHSGGKGYVARKETVAVAPSGTSENNNKMKMSGNFNGKGDPITGCFDPDTKTFTPDGNK